MVAFHHTTVTEQEEENVQRVASEGKAGEEVMAENEDEFVHVATTVAEQEEESVQRVASAGKAGEELMAEDADGFDDIAMTLKDGRKKSVDDPRVLKDQHVSLNLPNPGQWGRREGKLLLKNCLFNEAGPGKYCWYSRPSFVYLAKAVNEGKLVEVRRGDGRSHGMAGDIVGQKVSTSLLHDREPNADVGETTCDKDDGYIKKDNKIVNKAGVKKEQYRFFKNPVSWDGSWKAFDPSKELKKQLKEASKHIEETWERFEVFNEDGRELIQSVQQIVNSRNEPWPENTKRQRRDKVGSLGIDVEEDEAVVGGEDEAFEVEPIKVLVLFERNHDSELHVLRELAQKEEDVLKLTEKPIDAMDSLEAILQSKWDIVHVIGKADSDELRLIQNEMQKGIKSSFLFFNVCKSEAYGRSLLKANKNMQSVVAYRIMVEESFAVSFSKRLYEILLRGEFLTAAWCEFAYLQASKQVIVDKKLIADREEFPVLIRKLQGNEKSSFDLLPEEYVPEEYIRNKPERMAIEQADFRTLRELGKDHLKSLRVIVPRDYQLHIVHSIASQPGQNFVVVLPPNKGKTYIGAAVIRNACKSEPGQKCLFIVPSNILVYQQSKALEEFTSLRCGILLGGLKRSNFDQVVKDMDVVVVTAGSLENILNEEDGNFGAWDEYGIGLVVVDECHHARKGHPMKKVLTHPKILGVRKVGLTATLGDQSRVKDILNEGFEDAHVLTARFEGDENSFKYQHINAPKYTLSRYLSEAGDSVKLATKQLLSDENSWFSDVVVTDQISDADSFPFGYLVSDSVHELWKMLSGSQIAEQPRILVLVQRIDQVKKLYAFFQERMVKNGLRFGFVVGRAEMGFVQAKKQADDFREGSINVLFGTSAIEEGFDIPSCDRVIIMTQVKDAQQFTQIVGRARMEDSHVVLIGDSKAEDKFDKARTMAKSHVSELFKDIENRVHKGSIFKYF